MESKPKVRHFEDLWIWQEARQLVRDTYQDFGAETAAERDFTFRDQVRRAALSIMNNIAEGFERPSKVEFRRYLDIAKASSGEVRSMYYVAEDLGYVSTELSNERRERARRLSAGISSLKTSLDPSKR